MLGSLATQRLMKGNPPLFRIELFYRLVKGKESFARYVINLSKGNSRSAPALFIGNFQRGSILFPIVVKNDAPFPKQASL